MVSEVGGEIDDPTNFWDLLIYDLPVGAPNLVYVLLTATFRLSSSFCLKCIGFDKSSIHLLAQHDSKDFTGTSNQRWFFAPHNFGLVATISHFWLLNIRRY